MAWTVWDGSKNVTTNNYQEMKAAVARRLDGSGASSGSASRSSASSNAYGKGSSKGSGQSSGFFKMDEATYDRYENEYNNWQKTGKYSEGVSSWFDQSARDTWAAIRDSAGNGGKSALIDGQYIALDKGTYDRYDKEYKSWEKTGKYSDDIGSWYKQDERDAFAALRDYDIDVQNGVRPSAKVKAFLDTLDPDVLAKVGESYIDGKYYDLYDPEDMARKEAGQLPKYYSRYYNMNDEIDRYLWQNNLPNDNYLSKMYHQAESEVLADREYKGKREIFNVAFLDAKKKNPDADDYTIVEGLAGTGQYDDVLQNFYADYDDGELESYLKDQRSSNPYYFNFSDLEALYTQAAAESGYEIDASGKVVGADGEPINVEQEKKKQSPIGEFFSSLFGGSGEETDAETKKTLEEMTAAAQSSEEYQRGEYARLTEDPNSGALADAGDSVFHEVTDGWHAKGKSIFKGVNGIGDTDFVNGVKMYTVGGELDYLLDPGYPAYKMTDEEKSVFNYYAKNGGEKKAIEYFNALLPELNARVSKDNYETEVTNVANMAEEHPIVASIGGTVAQVANSLEGYAIGAQGIGEYGTPVTKDDPRMRYTRMSNYAREEVSKDMTPTGQLFYQTGMSILDNLARMPMGKAGLALMAGNVMSSRADELINEGATSDQALAGGFASACIEVITEYVSLDKILNPKLGGTVKEMAKEALKQAGIEASEEAASEILNLLFDVANRQDDSEWRTTIAQYMESGMSEEEAQASTFWDYAKQVIWSAIGGAISGGIMGSGTQFVGNIMQGNDFDGTASIAKQLTNGMELSKAYNDAVANGGKALTADVQRQVAVDLGTIGLDSETATVLTKMTDQIAEVPQAWMSDQGIAAVGAFTETVTQKAAEIRARGAEFSEAQTKAQTRLNTLYGDIAAAQEAANAAREAGDVNGYTQAVGSIRAAMQAYQDAVTNTKAELNTKKVKTETADKKARAAVADAGKTMRPVVESEYTRMQETVSAENAADDTLPMRGDAIDMTDYAMNAGSTQYHDGINRVDTKTWTPSKTRKQLRVLDALGKKYGAKIVIEDTISRTGDDGKIYSSSANGYYDTKDGTIHLALDADEGAYMYFAVHELTHKIQNDNPAAYQMLKDFIAEKLNGDTAYSSMSYSGNTLEERIQSAIDHYASMGKNLTYDEAFDEIIADAMPVLLTDKATVKDLVRTDRTLAEHIRDFFEDFYNAIMEATANLVYGDANKLEMQALANDRDAAKAIADMFRAALEGATDSDADVSSAIRYSAKDAAKDGIRDQIRRNIDKINAMEVAVSIESEGREGRGKSAMRSALMDYFGQNGVSVDRQGFGRVTIDSESMRSLVSYVKTDAEYAAIKAVPYVIKRGEQIGHHVNHKGKGIETFTFGSPVELNGVRGNMGVVVQRTTKNRGHCSRILMPDGTEFELRMNNDEAGLGSDSGLTENGQVEKRTSSAYDDIISGNAEINNTKKIKKSFSLKSSPAIANKGGWVSGHTFGEVKDSHPTLFELAADEAEKRNPTQIKGTETTYRKIYDIIKGDPGFSDGSLILDASSGLGQGTQAGRSQGLNVEDVEPFPDSQYQPMYTDYTKIGKKYDYIISNAVLNVLPQDLRNDAVYTMGSLLKDGGKLYVNVRGDDVTSNKSNIPIDAENMEYFVSSTGSYQKGFARGELVAYLRDALGSGFTVEPTNRFGKISAIVTKNADNGRNGSVFSMKSEAQEEALRQFGKTYDWNETGYILTDGTKLDFSGKSEGAAPGHRALDHRDILPAYGDDTDISGTEAMVEFMKEGNIRIMPEIGGINLTVMPTMEQKEQLSNFVSKNRGDVTVDIDDAEGNTLHSIQYPRGTHANRVLHDLTEYFNNGTVPTITDAQRFHYALKKKGHNYTYEETPDYDNMHVDARVALKKFDELKRVKEENARLSGMVDALKEQFQVTKGYKPNEKALTRVARSILRKYGSKYDQQQLSDDLRDLFDSISDEKEFDGDTIMAAATSIARKVLNESAERDDSVYDMTAGARDYFRRGSFSLTETQKQDIGRAYDGFNNFRRKYFGKLGLSKDGIKLDECWDEICSMTGLDPNTSEGDMPMAIAEYLDSAYERPYVNPFGTLYDMDDAAYDLATELFDDFFHVPQVQTFADKQRGKLNEANRKYRDEMAKMRQDYEDRYNDAIALTQGMREIEMRRLASEYEGKMADQKQELGEKYRNMVSRKNLQIQNQVAAFTEWRKNDRTKNRERGDRAKAIESVQSNSNILRGLLQKPEKGRSVPVELQAPIMRVLESLDYTGPRGGTAKADRWDDSLRNLSAALRQINRGSSFDEYVENYMGLPEEFCNEVDELASQIGDKTRLSDLDGEQLKSISNILKALRHRVYVGNRMLAGSRYETIASAAMPVIEKSEKRSRSRKAESGVAKLIGMDMMDSYSFFHSLGEGGEAIYRELDDGFQRSVSKVKQTKEFVDGIKAKYGLGNSAINKFGKLKHTVPISGNRKVTITAGQAMELYALSRREQGMQHILSGGIEVGDQRVTTAGDAIAATVGFKAKDTGSYTLSEDDVARLTDILSDSQKEMVRDLQDFLSREASQWGNETFLDMYGYARFGEDNYWPISAGGSRLQEPSMSTMMNAVANSGFTKALNAKATNPVRLNDVFDTFTKHASQMATYYGMAAPIDDAMRWMNYKARDEFGNRDFNRTTKKAVERIMGSAGVDYFRNLIKDINGLSEGGTGTEIPNKLISNYKRAAVGAKLRVVVQQPTSLLRAASMVDPKYFMKMNVGQIKANRAEMMEKAPIAWWKSQGNYEIGTGRSMRGIIVGSEGAMAQITDASMKPAGWADDMSWSILWGAVKNEVRANNSTLNGEEFYDAVISRFTDVANRTQVVDTVLNRSQIMRSKNTLAQMSTAFMSEPTKTFNIMRNAIKDASSGGRKEVAKLLRTVLATFASLVANGAVTGLYDSLARRKKGEDIEELFKDNFWNNLKDDMIPMSYIPYVRDVWSIMQGDDVERMDMSGVDDLVDATRKLVQELDGDDDNNPTATAYKTYTNFAKAVSSVTGIPINGIMSTGEAIINTVSPGAIRTKRLSDSKQEDYDALVEKGIDDDLLYTLMTGEIKGTTNVEKAVSIINSDIGLTDAEKSTIGHELFPKYKGGSLESFAKMQGAENKRDIESQKRTLGRDFKRGKIDREEYDEGMEDLETKYDYIDELLATLMGA